MVVHEQDTHLNATQGPWSWVRTTHRSLGLATNIVLRLCMVLHVRDTHMTWIMSPLWIIHMLAVCLQCKTITLFGKTQ